MTKTIMRLMQRASGFNFASKKILLVMMLMVVVIINGWGQPQMLQWVLPPNQLNFNSTGISSNALLPIPTSGLIGTEYSGQLAQFSSNSYHDASGNLLFFVVDDNIYDKDGYFIDQMRFDADPYGTLRKLGGEIGIVPVPGSATQFYIILGVGYISNAGSNSGTRFHPEYGKLDLSLSNGYYSGARLGALDFTPNTLPNDLGTSNGTNMIKMFGTPTSGPAVGSFDPYDYTGLIAGISEDYRFSFATTPYRCDYNNYLFYVSGYGGLFRYIIDASGITFDSSAPDGGVADNLSLGLSTSGDNYYYTELEIIRMPGGGDYRLAKVYGDRYIMTDDFLYSDGTFISGSQKIINVYPTVIPWVVKAISGLEISSSGDYVLYTYMERVAIQNYTGYVDLTASTYTDFAFTGNNWAGDLAIGSSFIELGYDGNMYYNKGFDLISLDGFKANPATPSLWTGYTSQASVGVLPYNPLNATLPDQIDGNIYSLPSYTGEGACCWNNVTSVQYTANNTDGFSLNKTQTWAPGVWNPFAAIWLASHPGSSLPAGFGTASDPIIIGDYIKIPPDYNITMYNLYFEFFPRVAECLQHAVVHTYGARVIVENGSLGPLIKGGKLTLDGTTLTSYDACYKGMWEGVEVMGVTSVIPASNVHGELYTKNTNQKTEISNAYYGVTLGKKTLSYSPDNGSANNGGWIQCDMATSSGLYTTFRNNYIDVYFPNFPTGSGNMGRFRNTTFTTDAPLNDGCYTPYAHAYLLNVQGVLFRSCAFKNDIAGGSPYPVIGTGSDNYGILGRVSLITCMPDVPLAGGVGSGGCTFDNLYYGILLRNGNLYNSAVTNSVFKNNYRGILFNSVPNAIVNVNNFTIYPMPGSPDPTKGAYGLYMDYSRAFSIEANYCTDNASTYASDNDYGIIINESNATRQCGFADLIYRNKFENINIGIQTQGNNSEKISGCSGASHNDIGLVMQCNEFVDGTIGLYDINVADGVSNLGNIAYLQGVCGYGTTATANNIFSHSHCSTDQTPSYPNPLIPENDYKVSATNNTAPPYYNSTPFTYNDYNWSANPSRPNCYTPCYPTNIPPFNGLIYASCGITTYDQTTACPSRLVKPREMLKEEIAGYDEKKDSLQNIIDYGNRQGLVDTIATGDEAGITAALLASSPYLSDRVLMGAIAKGLTASNLQSILVSNSPLSNDVIQAMDADSLPVNVKTTIMAAQNNPSAKGDVTNRISYFYGQEQMNINALIRLDLNTTNVQNAEDSVLAILSNYDIPEGKTKLDSAKIYMMKGDMATASNLVSAIRLMGGNDGFCDYTEVKIAVQQAGGNDSLILSNTALLAKMQSVSDDATSSEKGGADELLAKLQGDNYQEWITPINYSSNKSMHINNKQAAIQALVNKDHRLAVYPNPADDMVNVEVLLPEGITEATLEITDITGRRMDKIMINANGKQIINTSAYSKGIYLCTLKANDKEALIDKVKLVIIK